MLVVSQRRERRRIHRTRSVRDPLGWMMRISDSEDTENSFSEDAQFSSEMLEWPCSCNGGEFGFASKQEGL